MHEATVNIVWAFCHESAGSDVQPHEFLYYRYVGFMSRKRHLGKYLIYNWIVTRKLNFLELLFLVTRRNKCYRGRSPVVIVIFCLLLVLTFPEGRKIRICFSSHLSVSTLKSFFFSYRIDTYICETLDAMGKMARLGRKDVRWPAWERWASSICFSVHESRDKPYCLSWQNPLV